MSPASTRRPVCWIRCRRRSGSGSTWSGSTRAGSARRPRPVVQLRRRQRRRPGRPPGRLQRRRGGQHRGHREAVRPALRGQDGPKDFLANVGTANVVKDLDLLRAALGDEKLTYLGFSYGTLIGSAYAEAYPDKVRAMILDGAVDPDADPISPTSTRPPDSRRPSTTTPPTAPSHRLSAGHRPVQGRRRLPATWWTRWSTSRPTPTIRAAWGTATRSPAPSWRCTRRACGRISPTG